MAVFIFAAVYWVVSAHKWFKGPIVNVDDKDTPSVTYEEKSEADVQQ